MSDALSNHAPANSEAPIPPTLRQGPGAFAWISLALFVLAGAALGYAFLEGAHGGAVISALALIVLFFPTVILMAAWIEVHVDNRREVRRYEAEVARSRSIR